MAINRNILTLDEFRNYETRSLPQATGELSNLLRDISLAAKRINIEVNKAGLVDILGDAGFSNVQGEEVKKLDEYANSEFINVLKRGVSCAGIASEEMEDILGFDDDMSRQSKYVCLFDPLDGSNNIDVNISIGTIFSIYRRVSEKGERVVLHDFLQPGHKQVAAGYIIYGSSTMLVYATGRSVNGFTLDPSIGEFCLSHPDIKCPPNGKIYSVNHGYFFEYAKGIQKYIQYCQQKKQTTGEEYTQRYAGSLVADLHRNLLKGGIFLYPATKSHPNGKLRLQYECNPFAFIIGKAGGLASDGKQRILDVQPTSLHDRTPFFAGSLSMMEQLERFIVN
jgi:fructose-1,6-bisphosphatase I